ncbi:hypothetical protein KAR91_71795 [Candidatus Pacearchaeota archaeon]|nr:hypothetical protein [Candidatus Pacearchaeota archaeon]
MIIKNKILPSKRFIAMAVWPFIFVRKDKKIKDEDINHEKIHFKQQKELLLIGFYILYLIFWLKYGYRNMPFEKEAYDNDDNLKYLETRKHFAWIKYI